jgi:hypothetical protein
MNKDALLPAIVVAIVAGLISGYASVKFFYPTTITANTIKADKIRIIDNDSKLLAELATNPSKDKNWLIIQFNRGGGSLAGGLSPEQDPFINLFDKEKHMRLVMGTHNNEVGVSLMDPKVIKRADLKVLADGTPQFRMYDAQKKKRAALFLTTDGTPQFEFYDKDGKVTWQAKGK